MSTHEPKAAATGVGQIGAPTQVEIVYRKIDSLHVFEAPRFAGLHAADVELEAAFNMIGAAVTAYMRTSDKDALSYRPDVTFATFKKRLETSAHRDFDGYREARRVMVALTPQHHTPAHAHA